MKITLIEVLLAVTLLTLLVSLFVIPSINDVRSVKANIPCIQDSEHLNGEFYFTHGSTTVYMLRKAPGDYVPLMLCK